MAAGPLTTRIASHTDHGSAGLAISSGEPTAAERKVSEIRFIKDHVETGKKDRQWETGPEECTSARL